VTVQTRRQDNKPKKSHTIEQIVNKLREAEVLIGQG
jgi:hypothetical protein